MRRIGGIVWAVCVLVLGAAWILYTLIGPRAALEAAGENGVLIIATLAACFLAPLGIATAVAGLRTFRSLLRRRPASQNRADRAGS